MEFSEKSKMKLLGWMQLSFLNSSLLSYGVVGWMHQKFSQNNIEPLKDFTIGQVSQDDHQFYPKLSKPFRQPQRDSHRRSFTGIEAAQVEGNHEEEPSGAISELFPGFLAVGTLGSDPNITDPSTPTFTISAENITEKETEISENEFKLVNDSSRRDCHVSAGRSSHCSTLTPSEKPLEGPGTNVNGTTVFPLQGYHFGSIIEWSEKTTEEKKEHRTTLGELFHKTKTVEENYGGKYQREGKRIEKEADKSAVHVMKKMLKKKMLHATKSSTAADDGNAHSVSAETNLRKCNLYHGHNNGSHELADEDIMVFPQRAFSKDSIRCYKSQSKPTQTMISCNDSSGNREYWIKTDADYLVLEL
ncbi:hypothetical protein SLEP1_g9447 [Rubroshorea leprosula]|uniref:Uncharacterized protein n=1 Tax=Rubroshorea leprosula TaxID=152421 RepID=A0AAV5IEU1_9ROSI|nr:hypothetical protein SLEP1_g9447 [Rubroshorea leprosula]